VAYSVQRMLLTVCDSDAVSVRGKALAADPANENAGGCSFYTRCRTALWRPAASRIKIKSN